MIISASRRTDIPAFYAQWFINRVRAGYCHVPNPFRLRQIVRVSLDPKDVDVIIFWTRNPRPLVHFLPELHDRNFRFYFQYTLLDYPRLLDTQAPAVDAAITAFRELADLVGPNRLIWRYDPIVISDATPPGFHLDRFQRIGQALMGYTFRAVISFMSSYPKIKKRVDALAHHSGKLAKFDGTEGWFGDLLQGFSAIAQDSGMQLQSCAEELPLSQFGVKPGKCVDDEYIRDVFGLDVSHKKDPGQRKACGCVVSKDIGMYDTCLFGCQYCYATSSFEHARRNHGLHDSESSILIGQCGVNESYPEISLP